MAMACSLRSTGITPPSQGSWFWEEPHLGISPV